MYEAVKMDKVLNEIKMIVSSAKLLYLSEHIRGCVFMTFVNISKNRGHYIPNRNRTKYRHIQFCNRSIIDAMDAEIETYPLFYVVDSLQKEKQYLIDHELNRLMKMYYHEKECNAVYQLNILPDIQGHILSYL